MIDRYTLPEMAAIWSQEAKYHTWLKVELAVLATQEACGDVPPGTHQAVSEKATFDIERIDAIEQDVKHDVIAFLTCVGESVGEASRYVHLGMTSSDLIDTALSLQIQEGGALLLQKLLRLIQTVYKQAQTHQHTAMIGRSHGIHGEPITFGWKLLGWVDDLERQYRRLEEALSENRLGQISGAMGTYANISPDIEAAVCERLHLKPARHSTQVISRDIHAQLFYSLASLASTLEKIAIEIRHLQRTDVLELEEPFTKGQKGSSAMPHKRNPVASENITGLARMVRAYVLPALENVALWHERDISHSSVERIIFPDAFILMDYMLHRLEGVIRNWVVYPENMLRNMSRYGGVVFSQRVLLTLVSKGLSREQAYAIVQRNAHAAWNTETGSFQANLKADPEVQAVLSAQDIDTCFDVAGYLHNIDAIFERYRSSNKLSEVCTKS